MRAHFHRHHHRDHTERPGLTKALAALSAGDTLIVWKLDRLGRSLAHLVQLIADLGARGIGFRSLSDPIDTESAGGRLVLHIMGALAEFERSLIVERTQAGLQAAKKRGRRLGRPIKLTATQIAHARALLASGEDARTVARSFGVARSTLYLALKTAAAALPHQEKAKPRRRRIEGITLGSTDKVKLPLPEQRRAGD